MTSRLLGAFLFAVMLSAPLLAQDEPTPFWISDVPKPKKEAPKKEPPQKEPAKKAAVKKEPAKREPPPQRERPQPPPGESAPKPKKKARRPAAEEAEDAPAAPPKEHAAKKPPLEKPARRAAPKKSRAAEEDEESVAPAPSRYQTLPPIPRVEPPAPAPAPQAYPAQSYPAPSYPPQSYPAPSYPAPSYPAPSYPPQQAPAYPAPQYPPAQAPAQYPAAPAPAYPAPYPPPAPYSPPGVVPLDEQRAGRPGVAAPAAESEAGARRRWVSLELVGGLWGKAVSDGQGHAWQAAYGVDIGISPWRYLELEVRGLRSTGSDGNAYASATTSHWLADGRALAQIPFGKVSLLAGAGGGAVLEQTALFLQDVDAEPATLSSNGIEAIGELVLGARAQPWKGLTLRLELDGLLRQGNFEPLFLLGVGWSF